MQPDLPSLPHMDQYVGLWACEERRFQETLAHVRTPELLAAHMAAVAAAPGSVGDYLVSDGGVAIVDMVGTMTKFGSSLSQMRYGTIGIRRSIRKAAADDAISAILLRVDSPGGTVAGTSDLADDVARAAKDKPVVAFIEDMGASAAYWVASQATRVVANRGALVGSIGTYLIVQDFSEAFAKEGIKTHVIRAGAFKGAGVEGAPVTAEDIAELQRVVTSINEIFVSSVASGRRLGMEFARALADGRVHVGAEAVSLGLVDGIESFQSALAALEEPNRGRRLTAKGTMSEPTAATLDEIRLYCSGADEKFILAQLERKATVDQVRSNWTDEQGKRIAALSADLQSKDKARLEAEAKMAEAEKVAVAKKPGVKLLADGGKTEGAIADPATEWQAAIDAKLKAGLPRDRAVRAVAHERPELREALVAAANEGRRKSA